MDTTMITEEMLRDIILGKANANGEKFWIKSINRASRSTLKGTIIEVAPSEDIGGGNSQVAFDKFSLIVEGTLKEYEKEINEAYINLMCNLSKEFKAFYDDAMLKIDEKTAEFRLRLVENFYQNGYVKNDIKRIFKGVGVAELQERLDRNKHSEWIAPIDNKLKKLKRDFAPGSVYSADLNPTLASEFGGIRPVLILASNETFVTVLPITSQLENSGDHKLYTLPAGSAINEKVFSFNLKDVGICTNMIKTIDKTRVYNKLATLKENDFNNILNEVADNVLGKDFKRNNADNDWMIFDEEEVAEFVEQQAEREKTEAAQDEGTTEFQEEKKDEFVEFVLTEEEARQVVEKKITCIKNLERGYEVDNLKFQGVDELGNYLFAANGYYTKSKDLIDVAEFKISKYHGSFAMGYVQYSNDYNLKQFIYDIMHEKYGEKYDRALIYHEVNRAHRRYMYDNTAKYEVIKTQLSRAIALTGKKAVDIDKLIKEGSVFYKTDFEPLFPSYEDDGMTMEDVMNTIDSEQPLAKTQPKVYIAPVEKKAERVEFELSDDEVMDIAEKKINKMWANGSKLSFYNPEVSGDGLLKNGISVFYNRNNTNPKQNIFPTEFKLKPFGADVMIGDKKTVNDYDLIESLAKKLSEKYPDRYPRLFAFQHIENQNKLYDIYMDLDKCSERLTKYLSFIGKKSADVEELVRYGVGVYKFEDLLDIDDENE